jgi:chromosome segregation ATPase
MRYEVFCDVCYYDQWAVRPVGEKRWGHCYHLPSKEEADGLAKELEELRADKEMLIAKVAEFEVPGSFEAQRAANWKALVADNERATADLSEAHAQITHLVRQLLTANRMAEKLPAAEHERDSLHAENARLLKEVGQWQTDHARLVGLLNQANAKNALLRRVWEFAGDAVDGGAVDERYLSILRDACAAAAEGGAK